MSFLHPIPPLPQEQLVVAKTLPPCCRDHVYIFLIHGMDPLDYANIAGVKDFLNSLGYRKTFYGQLYHTLFFDSELERLSKEDPHGRFVVIGFSFGANMARFLANSAREKGITIDLLVYLGGNTLKNEVHDQPDNVLQIVNILASGAIWNGAWMDRAENIHETDVFHFGSPTHPATLEVLIRELVIVAQRVPVLPPPPMAPPFLSPIPQGTGLISPAKRGEWDFLKPTARLGGEG
jgi:hypothetical protein